MKTEHLIVLAVVIYLLSRAGQAQAQQPASDPYSYTTP
jgi:hypothetical protein